MKIRWLLFLVVLGLAACGNRGEVAESKRTYQGKPDTHTWGDGGRAAWEEKIDRRTLAQNEYQRIGQ